MINDSGDGGHTPNESGPDWGPNRPTGRALRKFKENTHRRGIGLCLSGGGFRAALFHLGSLRRLNELGILSQATMISSVSGGAILAAHLAERLRDLWPAPGSRLSDEDWERVVAKPFREIASLNIRSAVLLRGGPWRASERLAAQYAKHVTNGRILSDLPRHPEFYFGATELVYRRSWVCSREVVGSLATGPFSPNDEWTVARAVAASSCFPPAFHPMSVWDLVPPENQDPRLPKKRLLLSDGGLYDNLGYLMLWNRCSNIIVSDGGGVLSPDDGRFKRPEHGKEPMKWEKADDGGDRLSKLAPYWRIRRYQAVQEYSGRGWEKGFLLNNLINEYQRGAYWGIATNPEHFGKPPFYGYPEMLVKNYIAKMRTDLDEFSPGEQAVLENHGYRQASAAADFHLSHLITIKTPSSPPHEGFEDAAAANDAAWTAIQKSSKRRKLPPPTALWSALRGN